MEEKMGSKFVEGRSVEFSKSYKESSPSTPIFFILSPGVDPLKDVEALGKYSRRSGPPWKRNIKPQGERPQTSMGTTKSKPETHGGAAGVEKQHAYQWDEKWAARRPLCTQSRHGIFQPETWSVPKGSEKGGPPASLRPEL